MTCPGQWKSKYIVMYCIHDTWCPRQVNDRQMKTWIKLTVWWNLWLEELQSFLASATCLEWNWHSSFHLHFKRNLSWLAPMKANKHRWLELRPRCDLDPKTPLHPKLHSFKPLSQHYKINDFIPTFTSKIYYWHAITSPLFCGRLWTLEAILIKSFIEKRPVDSTQKFDSNFKAILCTFLKDNQPPY